MAYALGTWGDINPMLALCRELKGRGHRILFLSNDTFSAAVQAEGLDFASVGSTDEFNFTYQNPELWNAGTPRGARSHVHEYHVPAGLRAFSIVQQLYRQRQRLAVLNLGKYGGAANAAERFGLPSVNVLLTGTQVTAWDTVYVHDLPLLRQRFGRARILMRRWKHARAVVECSRPLNAQRIACGLRKLPAWRFGSARGTLTLAMMPDWFLKASGSIPSRVVTAGFPLFDPPNHESRRTVDGFIGSYGKPIVFTPGSGVHDVESFFRTCVEVARRLDKPSLLLSRHWRKVRDLCKSGVLGCDYVDLGHVLPRSLALVHHGGVGTSAQAIRAGIPQLIRPLQFDQFDNAYRVWKLGLGAFIYPQNFSVESCTAVLEKMIQRAPNTPKLPHYKSLVGSQDAVRIGCNQIERALLAAP